MGLLKNSLTVLTGNMTVNFLNYLFNLVMARLLGPAGYGALLSLMASTAIAGIPTAAISLSATKFTADFWAEGTFGKIRALIGRLARLVFLVGSAIIVLALLFVPQINRFLKIQEGMLPILLLALFFSFNLATGLLRAILQGLQRFKAFSLTLAAEAALKLGVGVLLVILGLGLKGALGGLVASSSIALLIILPILKDVLKSPKIPIATKGLLKYSFLSLATLFFLAFLINSDVIIVKHFFSPYEAGQYGALSTAAKIILFVSSPVVATMFPMIAKLFAEGKRHFRLLLNSLILVGILSLGVLAIYFVAPGFVLRVLFGRAYEGNYTLLAPFGFAILLYSLASALAQYFLAIKGRIFLLPLGAIAILQTLFIWFLHPNFETIIKIITFSQALLLTSLVLVYIVGKRQRIYEGLGYRVKGLG